MKTQERWSLAGGGNELRLQRHTTSSRGDQDTTLVFDRR
jgi:hypothetical protein